MVVTGVLGVLSRAVVILIWRYSYRSLDSWMENWHVLSAIVHMLTLSYSAVAMSSAGDV